MNVYLITTNLKSYSDEYEKFEFEIKVLAHDPLNISGPESVNHFEKFTRVTETSWLLATKLSAEAIAFNLKEGVPSSGDFLVIKVMDDYSDTCSAHVSNWLFHFSEELI